MMLNFRLMNKTLYKIPCRFVDFAFVQTLSTDFDLYDLIRYASNWFCYVITLTAFGDFLIDFAD